MVPGAWGHTHPTAYAHISYSSPPCHAKAQEINDILLSLARVRGFVYVHKLRNLAILEEIVVTAQRNRSNSRLPHP